MKTSHRIVTGAFVLFLTVAAGFAAGMYFNTGTSNTDTAQRVIKPNHNTYDVSPPSRGSVIKTLPIAIEPIENTASVQLNAEEAATVKTGQKILLYDANDVLIDLLGSVTSITENGDDAITVNISLDADETIPASLAKRGEIVTERMSDAQRLPLSAVIMDSGNPYLWEIASNPDGTSSVYFKRANVTMETDDFVVIQNATPSSNIFVLNPDDKLEDGQKVNTRKMLYSGPTQTADQLVAAASYERRMNLTYERAMDAARAGRSSGNVTSGGCGQEPNITADFIAKIKSLAQTTSSPAPSP